MYLRFILPQTHPDTGVETGVFKVAYALKRNGELSKTERQEIEALLKWFDDELPKPSRFNRTKSKGYYRRAAKGISWLKAAAAEHVAKMHRLAEILRDHGYHVDMIKSANPGYIVYQDDFQIVAEPFNDMLKRR